MIWLQTHQLHTTTLTILQYLCSVKQKHTKYKHKHNESMHSEMGPVRQNPIQRTVRTAHLSVLMTVQRASIHNTTRNSSNNLPSYLQTNIIAQVLSVGGEGVERRTDRQINITSSVEVITNNVKFNQIMMIWEFNPLLGYFAVISLFVTKVVVIHSIHEQRNTKNKTKQ